MSINIFAPTYQAIQGDKPLQTHRTVIIEKGGHFTFPPASLQRWFWGYSFTTPGQYHVNVSYDEVDSNVISFEVRGH
jgi:hypothetical protein